MRIFTVLLVIAISMASLLLVASPQGTRWLVRRYRRAKQFRMVIGALSLVLLMLSFLCLTHPLHSELGGDWCLIVVAVLFSVLLAWPAIVRHGQPRQEFRRVLAIGAHPDDLELACGASLAKFVDQGHEVRTCVLSQGKVGGDSAVRAKEASSGSACMGARSVEVHDFPDTELAENSNAMVGVIEAAIRDFQPDLILTHSAHDYHQDHQAVHAATMRAARQHHSVLCFESPSATRHFLPSFYVNVEDYVEVKVQAVSLHRDQKGKPYMTAERVRGIAAFRGAQAKVQFAEGFEPVRLVGTAIGEF